MKVFEDFYAAIFEPLRTQFVERKSSSERSKRRRHLVGRVGHGPDVASSGDHLVNRQPKDVRHRNDHGAPWSASTSLPSAYSLLANANEAPELGLVEAKARSPFSNQSRKVLHGPIVRIECVQIAVNPNAASGHWLKIDKW